MSSFTYIEFNFSEINLLKEFDLNINVDFNMIIMKTR